MQRHTVICRRSEKARHEFVTLEFSPGGEDGPQWVERKDVPTGFKHAITHLLERIAGIEPEALQAISILQQRTMDSVLAASPLVDMVYDDLLATEPGSTITILAPIAFEQPKRTALEMWSRGTRWLTGPGGNTPRLFGSEARFVQRLLLDSIKRNWNDADDRVSWSETTYKAWAAKDSARDAIFVRPNWQLGELVPETYAPAAARAPVMTEQQLEAKRDGDLWKKRKAQVRGQWESRGYRFDKQRQTWRAPKG